MIASRRKLGRVLQPRKSRRELVRRDVTVCIAIAIPWFYGPGDFGQAIVTASDRMMTAGDIEYEPANYKV